MGKWADQIKNQKYAKTILILSFLCLKLVTVISSVIKSGFRGSILYVVLLVSYCVLALFCFRKDRIGRIATYLMATFMLVTAVSYFVVVFVAPAGQLVFKTLSVPLGLYFLCCGIILVLGEKGKSETPVA